MLEKISHQSTLSLAVPMSLVCFLVCVNILISTETNGGAGDLQVKFKMLLYYNYVHTSLIKLMSCFYRVCLMAFCISLECTLAPHLVVVMN